MNYLESESIGRDKLESFLKSKSVSDYNFTTGEFDKIDCFFKYKNNTIGVEIKNRDIKFEKYHTYIMEKNKLDYMEELQNEGKTNNCWMVYFFGDKAYIYSYKKIIKLIENGKISKAMKWLPNSTVNKTKEVLKPIYYLPKEDATIFERENNQWKITQLV